MLLCTEAKTQRGMLCKVSGEGDRKTPLLALVLDPRCDVVCCLSCAVTLHTTHCWMLSHLAQENNPIIVILTVRPTGQDTGK